MSDFESTKVYYFREVRVRERRCLMLTLYASINLFLLLPDSTQVESQWSYTVPLTVCVGSLLDVFFRLLYMIKYHPPNSGSYGDGA